MPLMKEKTKAEPDPLKPYMFHGMALDYSDRDKEALADCPFCGREGKFSVNVKSGLWRCFGCNEGSDDKPKSDIKGGNAYVFLRRLWEVSYAATTVEDYIALAADRKLLNADTLVQWGVAKSVTTGDWILPGYSAAGKLTGLYRYVQNAVTNRKMLMPTPTLHHHLFSMSEFSSSAPNVIVCEGPWDAMALWEVLSQAKEGENGFVVTSNRDASIAASAMILAVPTCTTFYESWLQLFESKKVTLIFDSDHPRENEKTNKVVPSAGWTGVERVTRALSTSEHKPESIQVLQWGPEGYDPDKPHGYDVRDALSGGASVAERVKLLGGLFELITDPAEEWIKGLNEESRDHGESLAGSLLDCTDYKTLVLAWRKAMRWTDGLDRALSVMLAAVTSTKIVGDQLWVKVIAPAATGKSTLCEALTTNKDYVVAKSTIRGFHSGYKTDKEAKEDNSLLAKLDGKTLVTKDGDTLLQAPNLGQILSEARDIYDKVSRSDYRNKAGRDYNSVSMTWILCGTASLRSIDSSELGERFLDCVIMDEIDDELEDEILLRVANRVDRNMVLESNGKAETQNDPDLTRAMQLTGGYIGHLRENAIALMHHVPCNEETLHRITRYGKFVAFMRARPSLKQDENCEREFATRLVSQLFRLAKCLAVVLNRREVDSEVMRRVHAVALDTSRGVTLDIVHLLAEKGSQGIDGTGITKHTNRTDEKTRGLLRFMRQLKIIESFTPAPEPGSKRVAGLKYRLTAKIAKLYEEVMA